MHDIEMEEQVTWRRMTFLVPSILPSHCLGNSMDCFFQSLRSFMLLCLEPRWVMWLHMGLGYLASRHVGVSSVFVGG